MFAGDNKREGDNLRQMVFVKGRERGEKREKGGGQDRKEKEAKSLAHSSMEVALWPSSQG